MIKVRSVALEDAKYLVEIYKPYVEETAITFDYSVPSIYEFGEKIAKIIQNYPFLVAEENSKILGYAYAGEFYPKDAYKWTAEITIYLAKEARGKGVGETLYSNLERELLNREIYHLTSCIAYPDEGSISFHEKRGFRKVAHFEKVGYKFDRWWDVVWYQKDIGDKGKSYKKSVL